MKALEVQHLYKGFHGISVLRDVDLDVEAGEVVAMIGESGAGKSTLGRIIAGLEGFDDGRLRVLDRELLPGENRFDKTLHRRVQYLFQNATLSFNPGFTCLQVVMEPVMIHNMDRDVGRKRALNLLKSLGLDGLANRNCRTLSGGQAQRLSLARALVMQPDMIVADEVTSGLDMGLKQEILLLLKDLIVTSELTLILITHELDIASDIATHAVVLLDGMVLESGPMERIMHDPMHPYTKLLIAAHLAMKDPKTPVPPYDPMHSKGCPFFYNCTKRIPKCSTMVPDLQKKGEMWVRCPMV